MIPQIENKMIIRIIIVRDSDCDYNTGGSNNNFLTLWWGSGALTKQH
jgi:hypothetical protein